MRELLGFLRTRTKSWSTTESEQIWSQSPRYNSSSKVTSYCYQQSTVSAMPSWAEAVNGWSLALQATLIKYTQDLRQPSPKVVSFRSYFQLPYLVPAVLLFVRWPRLGKCSQRTATYRSPVLINAISFGSVSIWQRPSSPHLTTPNFTAAYKAMTWENYS